MRVATSTFYQLGLAAMNGQQSSLLHTQQQLGTGRRVLTPSDDPVAATRALSVSQARGVNGQYAASRTQANNNLALEEKTLQSIITTIQNIQTKLVNGGNGTMSPEDRAAVATELESNYKQLLGLANADDGNGEYLFAGTKSGTPPFISSNGGVEYVGDTNSQLLQVDVARQMAIGDHGRDVFLSVTGSANYVLKAGAANEGNVRYSALSVTNPSDPLYGHNFDVTFAIDGVTGETTYSVMDNTVVPPAAVGTPTPYVSGESITVGGISVTLTGTPADGDTMRIAPAREMGTDVFANIQSAIDALRSPVLNDADQAALDNALATATRQMSNSLDNVLTVRASVGARMNELDALDTIGENRDLNYEGTLTNLQSLDYAAAITEYYQRSTALQAAQQSFIQIQGMNLFKFLR
ncbi:flagellar hook-associated protein FlgL [Cupriavidus sp. AU9028]|uniref:flagellar hook-associated protein FlgL n=1 Tax=Cupriavidus sp. AU9028 TaxID=2871157 RepID=UPI001C971073|nr:flagellar hook-associated protein FlgL [Cupriavidus sp. AU9028]MBY4898461.1 flagellar hook-associated protein FlgL [Cupriavidus sp. AU9028]